MLMTARFCEQDELHDPGADFEEYLACAVCGDNGKCQVIQIGRSKQNMREVECEGMQSRSRVQMLTLYLQRTGTVPDKPAR